MSGSVKPKNQTFAIGDIHGCADDLQALLDKLPLTSSSKLVFLGDYVDRGPDSRRVIDTILNLKKKYKVVTIKGNHEEMFLSFLEAPESADAALFILNGGSATLASYSDNQGHYKIPSKHYDFLNQLELWHVDDEHVYVHAGLPNLKLEKIDLETHQDELLWIREPFLSSKFDWGKVVVHGHTPKEAVTVSPNRINLDTGCVFGGHLSAMELSTGEIYSVKKSGAAPHTYLRSEYSQRIAHRFSGAIRVTLEWRGKKTEFITLNYNEFGMLVRQSVAGAIDLKKGMKVRGEFGAQGKGQGDKPMTFEGEVARTDRRGPFPLFGLKINRLFR